MKRLTLLTAFTFLAGCLITSGKASGSLSPESPSSKVKTRLGSIRAPGRGNPYINFEDGIELLSRYEGSAEMQSQLKQKAAAPRSLASADFDEDGVPDLICGYSRAAGGIITIHRGNIDSIYGNSPEAQRRKLAGIFTNSAFLSQARAFEVPIAADFVGTGDFDADGHWDVVIASKGGGSLYHLPGDGNGSFLSSRKIGLPGAISGLITGEVNRADGLTEIVVGVVSADGPKVLVYEGPGGALTANPEVFSVTGEPRALALGLLDSDYTIDLAVGAGSELVLIYGRDRKLSLDLGRQAEVSPAVIERRSFGSEVMSIAVGDFNAGKEKDLAILLRDGEIYLTAGRDRVEKESNQTTESRPGSVSSVGQWRGAKSLVTTRASAGVADELLVMNADLRELILINTGSDRGPAASDHSMRVATSLRVEGEPQSVLPMRLNADSLSDLVILHEGKSNISIVKTLAATTFTVNTTADHNDGFCNSKDCTLREAIISANSNPGADLIAFAIPGAGVHTIIPTLAEMPPIADSTTIDGTTQPGFAGTPVIELKGSDQPGTFGAIGIRLTASNNVIRGLVVNRFGKPMAISSSNLIEGNFIGTDVTGTVISGNETFGLAINGDGNTVGGTTSAARNLISGNGNIGLWIESGNGNQISGNFVGTDISGTVALGNESSGMPGTGMLINSSNNIVGGTLAMARNLISGNDYGVLIVQFGTQAQSNRVQGNLIGTNIGGNSSLGNTSIGVELSALPPSPGDSLIGGTTVSARNVISGSEFGIVIVNRHDNLVQGNFIGTGIDGVTALGNTGTGIQNFDSSGNTIGGATPGAGNTIAYSGTHGINIIGNTSTANTISSNAIFSNGLLGINLQESDVLMNDQCDVDIGPNNLQNYPTLTSAVASGVTLAVQGAINSAANSTFRIEFFSNIDIDPSGFGEGQMFIGSTVVSTNANCTASFSVILPAVPVGRFITATATAATGDTSEFSMGVPVQQGPLFDLCIQDESNGNLLLINSTTGEYQFTNCQGTLLTGLASVTKKGCLTTIQVNGADRRILARVDSCSKTGTAFIQLLSQGTSFSILDRNSTNNTCACVAAG